MRRRSLRLVTAGRAWWARSLGGHGLSRVRELDLDTHALALCAQQVLCMAPLIVALSAVLQRTTGSNVSVYIGRFFGLHDDSAADIGQLFGPTENSISTVALVVGLATAVALATSVASVQQRAFEMIWTLPRISGRRAYVRQLTWTPALIIYTVFSLIAGRIGHGLDEAVVGSGPYAATVLQAAVTVLFYWWTQHWFLRGRVEWRALLPGAIAVGVLTGILMPVSRVLVPEQIAWQVHAYGLVGAVFVLSVWLMVLSAVIFAGILIGALLVERRRRPAPDADSAEQAAAAPLTTAGIVSTAAALEHDDTARDDTQRDDTQRDDTERDDTARDAQATAARPPGVAAMAASSRPVPHAKSRAKPVATAERG